MREILKRRINAVEAKAGGDCEPMEIFITFIGAKDGKPDGTKQRYRLGVGGSLEPAPVEG
ncbi:MAG: hypothetical protein ABIM40_00790 [Pseudomonadota bacterium]